MSEGIHHTTTVTCSCGETTEVVNAENISWEHVDTDPNRGMGAEYTFQAEYQNSCDKCGDISITFVSYEYPEGCNNFADTSDIDNCECSNPLSHVPKV